MRLGKDALYAQAGPRCEGRNEYLRGQLTIGPETDDAREGARVPQRSGSRGDRNIVSRLCRTSIAATSTPTAARAVAELESTGSSDSRRAEGGAVGAGPARRARLPDSRPAATVDDAATAGRGADPDRGRGSIMRRDVPVVTRHRPGARIRARRARRLQHDRHDDVGLSRRDVPRGRVRAVGDGFARRARARERVMHGVASSTAASACTSTQRRCNGSRTSRARGMELFVMSTSTCSTDRDAGHVSRPGGMTPRRCATCSPRYPSADGSWSASPRRPRRASARRRPTRYADCR